MFSIIVSKIFNYRYSCAGESENLEENKIKFPGKLL